MGNYNSKYFDRKDGSLEEAIRKAVGEKLVGGQKELDKDNDGDIDGKDFAMLRKQKKEGNKFGKALKDAREKGDKTFVVSGKTYKVEDFKQDENFEMGTPENTKSKLDATPGQSADEWQEQVDTMQKKNASMREALAKIWGMEEGHNPFDKKEGKQSNPDNYEPFKKKGKKEDTTMTGKPMTKVSVDPDMKEVKIGKKNVR
tara:strand:+ start:331 stop:933 length:603 start_codon:yes stop_codon:yes gene_type:complete